MSMISPETYISELKDKSYEELIKERNTLMRDIKYFEKHRKELTHDENIVCHPTPETQYYWHLHYLVELIKLIIDKYEEE